jgi:hypothetical protein
MKASLLLLLLILLPLSAFSQAEPVPEALAPVPQVRGEILIVRLPEAKAMELRPELLDPKRIAAVSEKLITMVKTNEATLVDWPVATTVGNERTVIENIHELRYANGYEMPFTEAELPVEPTPMRQLAKAAKAAKTAKIDPADKPDAPKAPWEKREGVKIIGGVPSSFETRNIGFTCEYNVESFPAPGAEALTVFLSATYTTFEGFRSQKLEVEGKYAVTASAPEFQTQRSNAKLLLHSGQPHLLGFYKLRQPEKTVEVLIATFTILEEEKPAK